MRIGRPTAALHAPTVVQGRTADVFLMLVGSDTIGIERFTRSPQRFDSELFLRPGGAQFTIAATINDSGRVTRLENTYRQAVDRTAPPTQHAVFAFVGDSVIIDITTPTRKATQRLGTRRGVFPLLNTSFALTELMIQRALAAGRDSATIDVFAVQGGMTIPAKVQRLGRDSVVVQLAGAVARFAIDGRGSIVGGGVPAQRLRLIRTTDARMPATLFDAPKPDYAAPSDAPYSATDVRIPTHEGFDLAGTLTLPAGASGPVAALVTISGSGSQDRDSAIPSVKGYRPFRQIADSLARRGIATLRMDDRGFGASGGNAATATSADFANDVRAALAFLRARSEIDPARIGLIGHSEGGMIAPMVAVDDPSVRALILMAGPSRTGRTIIDYQNRYAVDRAPSLTPSARDSTVRAARVSVDSIATAMPWLRFFLDHDPLVVARRVKAPVLILQGATDRQITSEQAEELASAIRSGGNGDVTIRVFPETNHLFLRDSDGDPGRYTQLTSVAIDAGIIGLIVDWAVRTLR